MLLRRRAITSGMMCAAWSISSVVVSRERLKRIEPWADAGYERRCVRTFGRDRQGLRAQAVHPQLPVRQQSRIEEEQALREIRSDIPASARQAE